ncbi:hypothetical protein CI610_03426 [invertebrate metagenome]|uniref:Uncharacterized protein n=1 Tax=invertebrate metagenome TaxID=1711999 RepID=A0A2H9T382_9ZZZZ
MFLTIFYNREMKNKHSNGREHENLFKKITVDRSRTPTAGGDTPLRCDVTQNMEISIPNCGVGPLRWSRANRLLKLTSNMEISTISIGRHTFTSFQLCSMNEACCVLNG